MALVQVTLDYFPPSTFTHCLFLFTTKNVDKEISGASPSQRLDMMTLLAKKQPLPTAVGVTTSGRFVDKATELLNTFSNKNNVTTTTRFCFILGYDTLIRLLDPKYYHPMSVQEALHPFFQHSTLVCVDRDGYGDMDEFWQKHKEDWVNKDGKITRIVLNDPKLETISSSLVRSIISNTRSTTGVTAAAKEEELETMVDRDVAKYIRNQGLYLE
ncbi:hypothetical protein INT45_007286 [Circinella minor]|uniref:Nicotinamide-nucleotide adenylyltransferase n=1 Tax=Circinella minor TaxID=1195481 RepID=A0A8H7S916_9FUNG|nr:hypothetical protein INT45_007286 [Circinella minor]